MEPPIADQPTSPASPWQDARIDAKTGEGKVTIYDRQWTTDIHTHEVAIHTFNPDEFGFRPLDAFINWFKETFNLRTVVRIDQDNAKPLYIKIDDLKAIYILQSFVIKDLRSGEIADFKDRQVGLRQEKMLEVQSQIKQLAIAKGIALDPLKEGIEQLFKLKGFKEAYDSVVDLIDRTAALKEAEAEHAKLKAAAAQAEAQQSQKKQKKGEAPPTPIVVPTPQEIVAAKKEAAEKEKYEETAKKEVLKLADEYYKPPYYDPSSSDSKAQQYRANLRFLEKLGDRVGYGALFDTLKKNSNQTVMMETYLAVGKQLLAGKKDLYQKRVKNKEVRITHAFRIEQKDIFIIPEKKEGEIRGPVVEAILLNDHSTPYFREKLKGGVSEHTQEEYRAGLKLGVKHMGVMREDALELHHTLFEDSQKNKIGPSFIVPLNPHLVTHGQEKKYMQFVKKTEGTGVELAKAPAAEQLAVLTDAAKGLAYLHEKGFVHMNVTPSAIVVDKGHGKISETGWAMKMGQKIKWFDPSHGAPEVLKTPLKALGYIIGHMQELSGYKDVANASRKMDAFSFGVTLFEIVNGSLPQAEDFADNKPHFFSELRQKTGINVAIKMAKDKIGADKNLSKEEQELKIAMLDIAHQLLQRKPDKRITCQEAAEQLEALKKK